MTRGRVLIAVTHLLGTGHIARAAAIASGLARAGFETTLVSGGMPAPTIAASGAFRFEQLPPVRIAGTDYSMLIDEAGETIGEAYRAQRNSALAEIACEARPQAVVTEHFPFGRPQLAAEFLNLIDTAKALDPRTVVTASIRDVLTTPRPARGAQIIDRVDRLYDAVLVHGDPKFLPLQRLWPGVPPSVAAKLIYTGYVGQPALVDAARTSAGGGEVLVSGGGSAVAFPLYRAAVAAACGDNRHRWRILVGHGVAAEQFDELQEAARPANGKVIVERARRDFPALLAACAVSVSQGGYNTAVDLFQARCPAVLVPYEGDSETDQVVRAQAMADAGLCVVCESASLSPERLVAAVDQALSLKPPSHLPIKLDGAAEIARVVGALIDKR